MRQNFVKFNQNILNTLNSTSFIALENKSNRL